MYGVGIVLMVIGLIHGAEMFLWGRMSEPEKMFCAIESADFKTEYFWYIVALCIIAFVFGLVLLIKKNRE